MFEIKGLNRITWLFLLLILWVPGYGKNQRDSCYRIGQQVVDSTCPCCKGLKKYTEKGTNKVFCDAEITGKSRTYLWISILAFPFMLLIFLIFGIRNKLKKQRK